MKNIFRRNKKTVTVTDDSITITEEDGPSYELKDPDGPLTYSVGFRITREMSELLDKVAVDQGLTRAQIGRAALSAYIAPRQVGGTPKTTVFKGKD
jgi:hypothetical protein